MDAKTKSIIIGIASAFAAVMIIIFLFFTISGINGEGSGNKGKSNNNNHEKSDVVSVDSDGNIVVIIDDEDDEEESSKTEDDVSSEEETAVKAIFGRDDIDGITAGVSTFSQFVDAVSPVSYEWNTDKIKATSEVEVMLLAYDGSYAVIGVPYESSDYTIDGEIEGSGTDVTSWKIYGECKNSECRAKEIVWFSNKMKFSLPRGVKIGADYPSISEAYYKTKNPEKSYILYDAKEILTDNAKLKKYNKASGAFIGGKVYKTTTMVEYNYKNNPDAYPFTDISKNIIRYGFNSIYDTEDTLGQWYIDYATNNSKVMGVYYHMIGADD